MSNKDWKGQTGGGNFGQKFLFSTLKYFPVVILYPIIYFVIFFYVFFDRKHFLISVRYFKVHFKQSTFKAYFSAYFNYVCFAKVVLDKFAMLSGNVKQFKFKIFGQEHFEKLLNSDEGFVIASAHTGNFELLAFALHQEKKKINALVFDGESKVYQEKRYKAFEMMQIHPISIKEDMSHLFEIKECLANGNILTILCDRIFGSEKRIELDFLNKKADFPQGPFRLILQLNANVISIFTMKKSFREYYVYCEPVRKSPSNSSNINRQEQTEIIAKSFVGNLEYVLKKFNKQWFNYYDFWK